MNRFDRALGKKPPKNNPADVLRRMLAADPRPAKTYDQATMNTEFYTNHRMPCCGATEFTEGPSGGMSVNIRCAGCGEWFNICAPMGFIEKIGNK